MMEKMPPNRLKTPLCIDTFDLKKALKNKTKTKCFHINYKLLFSKKETKTVKSLYFNEYHV